MITEDFKLNVVSDMSGGVYGGDEASAFIFFGSHNTRNLLSIFVG